MTRTKRYTLIVLIIVSVLNSLMWARDANAAALPRVMIEETLSGGTWNKALAASVAAVDRYTDKTQMVYGKCNATDKCIRIGVKATPQGTVGMCYVCGTLDWYPARIDLSPTYNKKTFYEQRHLITHELAHAFGVPHNPATTSVMFKRMGKLNGKPTPYAFISSELAILKGQ